MKEEGELEDLFNQSARIEGMGRREELNALDIQDSRAPIIMWMGLKKREEINESK